jgi:hypothetical protein
LHEQDQTIDEAGMRTLSGLATAILLGSAAPALAGPELSLEARIGFYSPGCNCTFNAVLPSIFTTVPSPAPVFGNLDSDPWHARGAAWYGVLSASAAVEGTEDLRHQSFARAAWRDTFLITNGTGTGMFKIVVRVDGHLDGPGQIDFGMVGDPFQGTDFLRVTTQAGESRFVDQEFHFQHRFTFGEAFELSGGLAVTSDAFLGQSSNIDFASTARVTSIFLIDPDTGLPLVDAIMETGSGVDFTNLASFSFSPVPEPALTALAALPLLAWGWKRRHVRRRAQPRPL